VADLPRLYRAEILDPLRGNLSAATLSAWDAYIAMKSADSPDRNTWATVDYPPLQFQRGSDDFYIKPSSEKLELLVGLVKNNPNNPEITSWITQLKQMIQDYRSFQSTGILPRPAGSDASSGAPSAPDATPPATAPAPATTSTPVSSPPPAGA
jgi:hypothetical protein